MAVIKLRSDRSVGKMKPMHAVNNAPVRARKSQCRGNFETFKALRIPYARTHDASLSEIYGSQHVMDVHCIFPDFSRDPDDPAAYDFINTDQYITTCFEADCEIFYRLGTSIEHWPAKYGSIKPSDPLKWAKICEHIILHYTEGWADGFRYPITYWEIWNEADLDADDAPDKRNWSGTAEEFFEFFKITFLYLRKRFPNIKLGGPALAGKLDWMRRFLERMTEGERVELDFFSWHIYSTSPEKMMEKARAVSQMLDEFGYAGIERHLNEWNYIENWNTKFIDSVRVIKGLKGAAYDFACMCAGQNSPHLDMMMYYDARPDKEYNGLWDSDFMLPLKGYYAFAFFSDLYQLGEQAELECDDPEIYALAAKNESSLALALSYYTCRDDAEAKSITVSIDAEGEYDVFAIDGERNGERIASFTGNSFGITIEPNTLLKIERKKKMIRIGTYVHGGGEIEEKIAAIKNAGFDFVAIGMGALSDGTLDYQVGLCQKYGLPIDNIHLTGSKTTEIWFEGKLGDEVCDRYCKEIEMAAAAGIKKGVAHITWGHKDPGEVNEYGIARLTRMADCALGNGFLLCLENSIFIEHLYATMERLKDHPAVRFTYDSGHRNAFAQDFDLLGAFGDKLAALHIDDNDAAHDLHLMPFDGNIDWERDARELARTEFARQCICAETSYGSEKKIKDMSGEEISAMVDALPIAKNPELFTIEGGIMRSYTSLSYADYMVRLHERLKKLAGMIEANI